MRDEAAKRIGPTSLHLPAAGGEKDARQVAGPYEFGPFRLEPAERRLAQSLACIERDFSLTPKLLAEEAVTSELLSVRNKEKYRESAAKVRNSDSHISPKLSTQSRVMAKHINETIFT
jgi:hypothetical protein